MCATHHVGPSWPISASSGYTTGGLSDAFNTRRCPSQAVHAECRRAYRAMPSADGPAFHSVLSAFGAHVLHANPGPFSHTTYYAPARDGVHPKRPAPGRQAPDNRYDDGVPGAAAHRAVCPAPSGPARPYSGRCPHGFQGTLKPRGRFAGEVVKQLKPPNVASRAAVSYPGTACPRAGMTQRRRRHMALSSL